FQFIATELFNPEGLRVGVLRQLDAVCPRNEVSAIREKHVEQKIESPSIIVGRRDRDDDVSRHELLPRYGSYHHHGERSGITVVAKIFEGAPDLRYLYPISQMYHDRDYCDVVLVLVVSVKSDGRTRKQWISHCLPPVSHSNHGGRPPGDSGSLCRRLFR